MSPDHSFQAKGDAGHARLVTIDQCSQASTNVGSRRTTLNEKYAGYILLRHPAFNVGLPLCEE